MRKQDNVYPHVGYVQPGKDIDNPWYWYWPETIPDTELYRRLFVLTHLPVRNQGEASRKAAWVWKAATYVWQMEERIVGNAAITRLSQRECDMLQMIDDLMAIAKGHEANAANSKKEGKGQNSTNEGVPDSNT